MTDSTFTDADRIDGVIITDLARYDDARGYLMEFFRHDEMAADHYPTMGYLSVTQPGIGRGPHEHVDQTDTFCFAGPGAFLLALWDNRTDSPTYGHRMTIQAGADRACTAIIPPGVVHAYHCISNEAGLVINVPNRLYRGEKKADPVDEVRHEDDPNSPFMLDFAALIETTK